MKNIQKLFLPSFILICLIVLNACVEDQKEMLISTSDVSNILATSAEASGSIIDLGDGATQHGHCYAKTPGVTIAGSKTELGVPNGTGSFKSQLINLEEGTTYYIRAYLSDRKVTVYGSELSFTTGVSPAVVSTDPANGIIGVPVSKVISATFSHSMDPSTITTSTFTIKHETISVSGTVSFSGYTAIFTPTNTLDAGTIYTGKITTGAKNLTGIPIVNDYLWTFTTQQKPDAQTSSATTITNTSATVNGVVNPNGGTTNITFEYGLTSLYGSTTNALQSPLTGTNPTNVNAVLTGLIPGTTYHFRVKATSSGGAAYGSDLTFTLQQLPEARTEPATNILITTATLHGTVTATNLPTSVTFEYGPSISYGSLATGSPDIVTGVNPTSVSTGLTGLTGGTTYHFRVKVVNSSGTTYGDDLTFITEPQIQVVLTIRDATTWTVENSTLGVVPNAVVKLYASQSSFINNLPDFTTTSDLNGIVKLSGLTIQHQYFLVVTKGDLSNIKDGYVIADIFHDQAEVDASPAQPGGKIVGGLKYLDANGDAVINSNDQVWHDYIYLYDDQTIAKTVVIGK